MWTPLQKFAARSLQRNGLKVNLNSFSDLNQQALGPKSMHTPLKKIPKPFNFGLLACLLLAALPLLAKQAFLANPGFEIGNLKGGNQDGWSTKGLVA